MATSSIAAPIATGSLLVRSSVQMSEAAHAFLVNSDSAQLLLAEQMSEVAGAEVMVWAQIQMVQRRARSKEAAEAAAARERSESRMHRAAEYIDLTTGCHSVYMYK